MATNGLVVMTPSSIAYSGTSASINADGSVDFSAVTSLSLNGVFTGDYDNYMIVMRYYVSSGTGNPELVARLRVSGQDASGSNYTRQYIYSASTAVSGLRTSSATVAGIGYTSSSQRSGEIVYVYGPHLAQPTAFRNNNVSGETNAALADFASTHSLSTSYTGITIFGLNPVELSGLVSVFGFNQ